jgi:hypothetical protein
MTTLLASSKSSSQTKIIEIKKFYDKQVALKLTNRNNLKKKKKIEIKRLLNSLYRNEEAESGD